jgi:hypothetical protein
MRRRLRLVLAQKNAFLCSAKCADAGGSDQAYQQWCVSSRRSALH